MSKVYVGSIGTVITLDCGEDVSAASVRKIKAKRPDGTTVDWTAVADGTNGIAYTTVADDLNQAGVWYLQAYVELSGGWKGPGDTVVLMVYGAHG